MPHGQIALRRFGHTVPRLLQERAGLLVRPIRKLRFQIVNQNKIDSINFVQL